MGGHAEAERALRKAIAGFKALPPDVRAEKEENLGFTIESMVIVLRNQGKTAAMQQLDEAELRPVLARPNAKPFATLCACPQSIGAQQSVPQDAGRVGGVAICAV